MQFGTETSVELCNALPHLHVSKSSARIGLCCGIIKPHSVVEATLASPAIHLCTRSSSGIRHHCGKVVKLEQHQNLRIYICIQLESNVLLSVMNTMQFLQCVNRGYRHCKGNQITNIIVALIT
jgi:hypothetical protein